MRERLDDGDTCDVNSRHHQAVKARRARASSVSATAPDGVIEAIEDPGAPLLPRRPVAPGELLAHRRVPAAVRGIRRSRRADRRQLTAESEIGTAQPSRSNTATVSTCGVFGNRSNASHARRARSPRRRAAARRAPAWRRRTTRRRRAARLQRDSTPSSASRRQPGPRRIDDDARRRSRPVDRAAKRLDTASCDGCDRRRRRPRRCAADPRPRPGRLRPPSPRAAARPRRRRANSPTPA